MLPGRKRHRLRPFYNSKYRTYHACLSLSQMYGHYALSIDMLAMKIWTLTAIVTLFICCFPSPNFRLRVGLTVSPQFLGDSVLVVLPNFFRNSSLCLINLIKTVVLHYPAPTSTYHTVYCTISLGMPMFLYTISDSHLCGSA
ncbi:hypothetical protein BABINDRAFT_70841 [Babjeviella inositovora NRRL Y-12698]|uniref:Uncharacterized protein n=1 Tax=Babjeviella inositovora NRRL Y-12698 TaxID=984486 RepID=A0A1E3QXE0_9ASCO|nr:uncharacterized protein BABINDRAFT_70841 [Babjeviella inositovora NRRL Y-12698]ODQ82339.1 hypothetical protein BABINDRAFT_70841 [Babjeviella inositovora NRRL Y-12698]